MLDCAQELDFTEATPLADNPFESAQRLIIEADSFAFHSSAGMLLKDCERYTVAAASGWRVARFGYRHVRRQQDWVHDMLERLVP